MSPAIARRLLNVLQHDLHNQQAALHLLTNRAIEVLNEIVNGLFVLSFESG